VTHPATRQRQHPQRETIDAGGKVTGDVRFAPNGKTSDQYVVLLDPSFRFTSDRIAWTNNL
jgi:hypothetical protein